MTASCSLAGTGLRVFNSVMQPVNFSSSSSSHQMSHWSCWSFPAASWLAELTPCVHPKHVWCIFTFKRFMTAYTLLRIQTISTPFVSPTMQLHQVLSLVSRFSSSQPPVLSTQCFHSVENTHSGVFPAVRTGSWEDVWTWFWLACACSYVTTIWTELRIQKQNISPTIIRGVWTGVCRLPALLTHGNNLNVFYVERKSFSLPS